MISHNTLTFGSGILNRMLRSTTFSAPVLRSANADEHLQLTPIDSLLGSTGVRNVLGMLTQLQEGRWYLEDEKANIQVDLSNASITAGLFTEGVVVVARGAISFYRLKKKDSLQCSTQRSFRQT